MSVINTMLQDLERRRVDLGHSGALRHVRSLPQGRAWRPAHFVLALLVGLVLAAGVWFGPNLWNASSRGPMQMPRAAPGGAAPAVLSGVLSARDPDVSGAQGLALTVSRELLWRESPSAEILPPRTAPATPAAARIGGVPARSTVPAPVAEAKTPENGEKARTAAGDLSSTPLVRAQSLSLEKGVPAVPAQAAPGAEIKQVNSQQRAENELRRGNDLLNQGRTVQAMEAFAQVLAWDPMQDAARQALVVALLRSKNSAEAERLLVERQALAPKSAGFAMILARLQAERGDNDLALETLRLGLSVAGANPTYHATMAALLARVGQHAQAVAQYQAALRLSPQSGVWWMGLGLSLQAVGSLTEAQEALRRARASDNLSPELAAFVEQRLKQFH